MFFVLPPQLTELAELKLNDDVFTVQLLSWLLFCGRRAQVMSHRMYDSEIKMGQKKSVHFCLHLSAKNRVYTFWKTWKSQGILSHMENSWTSQGNKQKKSSILTFFWKITNFNTKY
jgi:hypothetical protein